MKDIAGNWMHPPPLYEPIIAEGKCIERPISNFVKVTHKDVLFYYPQHD